MAKPQKSSGKSNSARDDRNRAIVHQLADWAERTTQITCGVLVVAFAWLQFSREDVKLFASEPAAELIFRVAMAIYLGSWSAGTVHDIRDQRDALIVPANDGRKTREGISAILLIAGMFSLMCYLRTKPHFALALIGLLVVNVLGWRHYVRRYMEPMIRKSIQKAHGSSNYFAVEKIENVRDYICGDWQITRFWIAGILAALLGALMYPGVSQGLANRMPGTTPHELESLGMMGYVLVVEGIMWYQRIRTRMGRSLLDKMMLEYALIKRN